MADLPVSTVAAPRRPSLARRVCLPPLSGKASAAWLVVCFALTALFVPMAFWLPRWIEAEIVVGLWWAIWLAVLAALLYRGQRVAHDHQLGAPRNWLASLRSAPCKRAETGASPQMGRSRRGGWWDGFFWGSMFGDEVAGAVAAVVAILVGGPPVCRRLVRD